MPARVEQEWRRSAGADCLQFVAMAKGAQAQHAQRGTSGSL